MGDIHLLKLTFNDQNFSHIENIRKFVFNAELDIPESELFDEFDKKCDHFLIFDGKKIVGSLRILHFDKKIKLERMAILKEFRGQGYGNASILQIKEYYSALDFSQIFLDSIYSVREFYRKCGFIEEGEIFQRVGIDHIRMLLVF